MHIKQFIILGLSGLLCGCIGEEPTTATATAAETTTSTPTATPTQTTTTPLTTADSKPLEFMFTSTSQSTLRTHYMVFNQQNISLDKRNKTISDNNLALLIKVLDKFSDKNLWETQNGPSDVPPAGAYATIKNNNSGSVALVDASYSLAQLTVEENSGLYISDKGELLAQTFTQQNNSWVIVPVGRIGAQSLTMGEGSVLDLIGGNGCILNADLKDLKVDSNNPKGILTVGEYGSADVFKSFISAHKVEQQGNIKAHQATFNLQPVTTGNYTNIEYLHQKGKIYPREGAKPDFFFQVNGLYKLKPDAVIEMFIYSNEAAPVNLRNPSTTNTTH